eukprot:2365956-Amphidinium_carterae.1
MVMVVAASSERHQPNIKPPPDCSKVHRHAICARMVLPSLPMASPVNGHSLFLLFTYAEEVEDRDPHMADTFGARCKGWSHVAMVVMRGEAHHTIKTRNIRTHG